MESSENSQQSPISDTEDIATIKEVFIECQESNKSERFVIALQKLYVKRDEAEFLEEFQNLLLHVLVHVGAETPVNRIFKVIINFMLRLDKEHSRITEEEEDDATLHPFVENMLSFLLQMEDASCHAVRIRALHLMSVLFKELNELPSDGEFWDSLYEMAASRLTDTCATVRAKAVSTFCYLQDPSSPTCPIIKAFLFHISRDPSFLVRRNIVSSIAVTSRTLSAVKMRLRDVNSSVRKTALLRISEKVSINCFSVSQRMEILNSCVNDLSNDVKLAVKQHLVPSWLKMCDNDIIKLLGLVEVQAIPEVMQKVLNIIFETRDVRNLAKCVEIDPDSHLISVDQLTVSQAFLWRCLCQFVKTMNVAYAVDFFDEITPTISAFSAYLEEFLNTIESLEDASDDSKERRCFIFEQILSIAAELDFSDIVGEKRLHALIIGILKSKTCALEMVKPLVVCMKSMEVNHRKFLQDILDIVSEIHRPVFTEDPDVENSENFVIIRKAMLILIEAWKFPITEEIFLEMNEMKDHVIMPVLKHENDHVRRTAVEALGLYSMFSVEEARSNYSRFMEAIIYGELQVQITALKVAFDILMIFGFSLIADLQKLKVNESTLQSCEALSEERRLAKFVEKLMPLLDSESQELVHVAAEGLAKVMITLRISSSTLFFKLCVMRYDPANEADAKLKFCIAAFMPEYAQSGALTAECVKETVKNILDRILDATKESELCDVDGMFVLKTVVQLVLLIPQRANEQDTEGSFIHDDLALIICNKILRNPNADFVPSLVKIFNLFAPTSSVCDELISAVERVRDAMKVRKLFKIMNSFFIKLNENSIVNREDNISSTKRHLSFSQNSIQSTEALSETPSITDVASNEDILGESQSTIDIMLDESDSLSEEEDIVMDPRFAECTPSKYRSQSGQNDSFDEIIIPESPESQQGNEYDSEPTENQHGSNGGPEASGPKEINACAPELVNNLKRCCISGSGEKALETSYKCSSQHEQKIAFKHEPTKSELGSYKVGSPRYGNEENFRHEPMESVNGGSFELISDSEIKKSCSVTDQQGKSSDDDVFLSGTMEI